MPGQAPEQAPEQAQGCAQGEKRTQELAQVQVPEQGRRHELAHEHTQAQRGQTYAQSKQATQTHPQVREEQSGLRR